MLKSLKKKKKKRQTFRQCIVMAAPGLPLMETPEFSLLLQTRVRQATHPLALPPQEGINISSYTKQRGQWQPTPVFLPGESQGWGSLAGCRLWGCTESDTTEATWQQQQAAYTKQSYPLLILIVVNFFRLVFIHMKILFQNLPWGKTNQFCLNEVATYFFIPFQNKITYHY